MTNPNPNTPTELPSAAAALRAAYDIVRTPCSAAETARATLLFEIARELRVAADMRALNARREAADKLRLDLNISRARGKLDAAGIPTPAAYAPTPIVPAFAAEASQAADRYAALTRNARYAGESMQFPAPDFAVAQLREQAPAQEWPDPVTQVTPKVERALDEPTQRMPIVWSVGDRADCRHCHTPIIYSPKITPPGEPDRDPEWYHKYTEQRACVAPVLNQQGDDEVPIGHTYAEPSL